MKFTPNKFYISSFLMLGFSGIAAGGPPQPMPAGPPPPPGFPLDGSLVLLVVLGIAFSFVFLKKHSSGKKSN